MKKVVLKLDVYDEKSKQKAMKMVSSLYGLVSLSMDMKDKKMTLTGDIDPVTIASKLRKVCQTELISVEPIKEEKKKEEPKNPEPNDQAQYVQGYYGHSHAYPTTHHYYTRSAEENPNACVIC